MVYQIFCDWLKELENLVFPQSCAGCDEWDTSLCSRCAEKIGGQWSPVSEPVPALSRVIPTSELSCRVDTDKETRLPFPVWRLGVYEGVRRNTIIRWKHQRSREMSLSICAQLRQRARELAPIFLDNHIDTLVLVPAPSRPRRKKEGLFVVGQSARAFAEGLYDGGIQAQVCDVLHFEGKVVDRRAKADAISCIAPITRDVPIVLVDDVLVTGSTFVGCVRALERQGGRVCCGFVIAQQEHRGTKRRVSP